MRKHGVPCQVRPAHLLAFQVSSRFSYRLTQVLFPVSVWGNALRISWFSTYAKTYEQIFGEWPTHIYSHALCIVFERGATSSLRPYENVLIERHRMNKELPGWSGNNQVYKYRKHREVSIVHAVHLIVLPKKENDQQTSWWPPLKSAQDTILCLVTQWIKVWITRWLV